MALKMDEAKSIDENINEFTKRIIDLENLDVSIDEEDQAIFPLNSLPKEYNHVNPKKFNYVLKGKTIIFSKFIGSASKVIVLTYFK